MRTLENVLPSIYSCDHLCFFDECKRLEDAGFQTMHVDIWDGYNSKDISFGIKTVKALRRSCNIPFDIHYRVKEVDKHIEELRDISNIKAVCFHPSDAKFLDKTINTIKALGVEAGLALGLNENPENYEYLADRLDQILLLTGDANGFNQMTYRRFEKVKELFPNSRIVVDGIIPDSELIKLKQAGAKYYVLADDFFDKDMNKRIKEIDQILG